LPGVWEAVSQDFFSGKGYAEEKGANFIAGVDTTRDGKKNTSRLGRKSVRSVEKSGGAG